MNRLSLRSRYRGLLHRGRSWMRGVAWTTGVLLGTVAVEPALAEDPFEGDEDTLAVKESDGSASVRAKLKLTKMEPDMIQVRVKSIDDRKFPDCTFDAQVLKGAKATGKLFKLIGRGKVYRFKPVLKRRGRGLNLKDQMTQNNLGGCYYPAKTKLVVKVGGIDRKAKAFTATAIYLK